MQTDLALAFELADIADRETLRRWNPIGVDATIKADGTPVTEADIAAEDAVLAAVQHHRPHDGFLGEEVGETPGDSNRRWIVDGIDGTRFFAAGERTWGTLIALEADGEILVGVSTSPAQGRRWWATRGGGAFTSNAQTSGGSQRLRVSAPRPLIAARVATLPHRGDVDLAHHSALQQIIDALPPDHAWSHQNRVAEGELDACVWLAGDTWDHAAPSIIVEEAGGRFSDLHGGRRLDTRTALYSNGAHHDELLDALAAISVQ